MTFTECVTGRFDGVVPDDLVSHCAAHVREADLPVEETGSRLTVVLPRARVELLRDPAGLAISIGAEDVVTLHQVREYLLYLLDHTSPEATQKMVWSGDILRNVAPLNFHLATFRSRRRVAPSFLRVELDCAGTRALAGGKGMHFSLLLPPAGREPIWPKLDADGRTTWPHGADSLHRAVYTFVALDPEAGRFSFDVFDHEGGRASAWAQTAEAGDVVGITGPGSGDFPPGDELLIAGDETALPAIRRILENSPPERHGQIFIEVAREADVCAIQRPKGMSLTWVIRNNGETLWHHLRDQPAPTAVSRYVWVAADQVLVRKAKARFRSDLGLRQDEGYFAYYWTAEASPTRGDASTDRSAADLDAPGRRT